MISFYGNDIQAGAGNLQGGEMLCVPPGTLSDSDFNGVCNNYFLGTIGPRPEANPGRRGIWPPYFWDIGARRFLILSGGASMNNYMHYARVQGMLEALAKGWWVSTQSRWKPSWVQVNGGYPDGRGGDYRGPGYFSQEAGKPMLRRPLPLANMMRYCAPITLTPFLPYIVAREDELGHSIRTGTVDCFSRQNFDIIKTRDAFGHVQSTTLRENTPPWPVRRLRRCTMP